MASKWWDRLVNRKTKYSGITSYLRELITGSLYKVSDMRSDSSISDIKTQIDTMRALARDSQISTALSYYATDATTTNTAGHVIWATATDDRAEDIAEIINGLFDKWNVDAYARDHILELATIGNLYIPTTYLYKDDARNQSNIGVVLDNNTIPDEDFDIIPSYKIPPESIVHLWQKGEPKGFILDPDVDDINSSERLILPESACIHFALGGLLGDYTLATVDKDGNDVEYDIQFASPMLSQAVQPTQTLQLLEDANILSSLTRTIKFIHVECGTQEEEIRESLQQIKDAIEQQISLNTATGDTQSYVNPQSPNNLIYLPKINGSEALTITDLNMAESTDADNKLLDYYQDKKLSVLGVPKEAMNYSSNEGLGGAGTVMSQRSALYANLLERLETAYMAGWKQALNKYFLERNLSGFIDKFELHMQPIITTQSTVQFEKRDAALAQASAAIQMLKDIGVKDAQPYIDALSEILTEVFPQMGADASTWDADVTVDSEGGGFE